MKLSVVYSPNEHMSICTLEDVPAGLVVDANQMYADLARSLGLFKHVATLKKLFSLRIRGSLSQEETLGGPLVIELMNNVESSSVYQLQAKSLECGSVLFDTQEMSAECSVRPHSKDLVLALLLGSDALEHERSIAFNQRLCAQIVSASLARELLAALGMRIVSCISGINQVRKESLLSAENLLSCNPLDIEEDEICCPFEALRSSLLDAYTQAREACIPLCGQVSIAVEGIPLGLGLHAENSSLSASVAQALFSLPECRQMSFGTLDALSENRCDKRLCSDYRLSYANNYIGGLEGGIASGDPLVLHAYFVPHTNASATPISLDTLASLSAPVASKDSRELFFLRFMAESKLALALANLIQDHYGHCSLDELLQRRKHEEEQCKRRFASNARVD